VNRPNEQGWLADFFSILLEDAMMVSVLWGLSLLAVLSYLLAQAQQIPAWKVIAEHVVIGVSVIAITHYVGDWIHATLS
jgi:vacuolar iron transporter family protein